MNENKTCRLQILGRIILLPHRSPPPPKSSQHPLPPFNVRDRKGKPYFKVGKTKGIILSRSGVLNVALMSFYTPLPLIFSLFRTARDRDCRQFSLERWRIQLFFKLGNGLLMPKIEAG